MTVEAMYLMASIGIITVLTVMYFITIYQGE